jgi:hypothetical protein
MNNFEQDMYGLIETKHKCIMALESRNSLKLGNAAVWEKKENTINLALPLCE